jgi:polyisoprenyl-teichoic acid--peptidoglycan teichoic acid transferase
MGPDLPPRVGLSLLKRAAIAAIAIVLMTAGAVSAAVFLQVDDIINTIEGQGRKAIPIPEIDRADAGEPRTIMILGSDARYGSDKRDRRSDTIILARLDPDKDAITLMSIPRDLKVDIPGLSYADKINAAYANGGARLTLKTVKQLLGTPERPFEINHVINIDFGGFRRAVDYLGCVYVDIDRRYFNDRGGPGGFATIDIDPGYQKICGRDALDYVRYRHTDNDIVRAARQQDFLRQMKDQDEVRSRLNFDSRKELAKLVGRYTDTDKSLRRKKDLFSLFKLAIFTAQKPVQEVQFGAGRLDEEGPYLVAGPEAIRRTVDDFLSARASAKPRAELEATDEEKRAARKRRKRKRNKASMVPGLEIAKTEGENQAIIGKPKVRFPFYFPTLRANGGQYAGPEPRTYSIRDSLGKLHRAYRMVIKKGVVGEYYGIQGMTWRDPPILDGPYDTETVNGRKLRIYYDGRRVRLVAWKTKKAVYYVHNTLLRTLSKRQMVAIAASLRRLGS